MSARARAPFSTRSRRSAPLALLALILHPAFDYASEEQVIVTPALEISNAWRAAAIPVGMTLMAVVAAIRLATHHRPALIVAALHRRRRPDRRILACRTAARPARQRYNLIIFFVGVVAANVFAGVPIAFSFALATFGYLALTTSVPMMVMVGRLDEGMSHLILLAVPLFIFLGALIEMTGMARAMIQFLASLLGHVRGGLSYVLIGAMYLVSGISGSKIADMAAIAPVLFPEMKRRGAKPGDLVALLSATGAQTETIPPSIVLITIGSVTGVSIAALFTGGLLPAAGAGRRAVRGGVAALPERGSEPCAARHASARSRKLAMVALPAHRAAVRDPRRRGRGRGHCDRGLDHRHRLLGRSMGLLVYRQFRLAAAASRCWSRRPRCRARSSSSSAAPRRWPGA